MSIEWETLCNKVDALCDRKQFSRALDVAQMALQIAEENAEQEVSISLNKLGGIYVALGQYNKAEAVYLRELTIVEKLNGPSDNQFAIAMALYNLATSYFFQKKFTAAIPPLRRALAILERSNNSSKPMTIVLGNLALTYYHLGHYDIAEPLFQQALVLAERVHEPNAPQIITARRHLQDCTKRAEGKGCPPQANFH